MEYKTHKWPEFQPIGKQNCIIWTHDGKKITCQFNKKQQKFVGMYNGNAGKIFDTEVKEWCYAILQKPLSQQLEDFIIAQCLHNGDIIAKDSFAGYPSFVQDRMYDELNMASKAIKIHYNKVKQ